MVLRPGRRRVLTGAAPGCWLLWLGFLPVFVAVRVVIYGYCAAGGCYRGSDIALGPDVLQRRAGAAGRLAAAADVADAPRTAGRGWPAAVPLLALVAAGRAGLAGRPRPAAAVHGGPAARRSRLAAAASPAGARRHAGRAQRRRAGHRRRRAAGARAGGTPRSPRWPARWCWSRSCTPGRRRRARAAGLVVLLALAATARPRPTSGTADRARARGRPSWPTGSRQEMADFDPTPAGDARRCALRAEFRATYADSAFSLTRFDQSLDLATRQGRGAVLRRRAAR